jgi:hypothetical protein
MATWEDVQRFALALPETGERVSREKRQWRVKDKLLHRAAVLSKRRVDIVNDRSNM